MYKTVCTVCYVKRGEDETIASYFFTLHKELWKDAEKTGDDQTWGQDGGGSSGVRLLTMSFYII